MAIEIEHKFLLTSNLWRNEVATKTLIMQGYLSRIAERTVRVRIAGEQAWLTIKGKNSGATRLEYEYAISLSDAKQMLEQLCEQPIIEKWRHCLLHCGHLWEIDEFRGENSGLIVAEIELKNENEPFAHPDWLGREVTSDPRYFNSSLIAHPYTQW